MVTLQIHASPMHQSNLCGLITSDFLSDPYLCSGSCPCPPEPGVRRQPRRPGRLLPRPAGGPAGQPPGPGRVLALGGRPRGRTARSVAWAVRDPVWQTREMRRGGPHAAVRKGVSTLYGIGPGVGRARKVRWMRSSGWGGLRAACVLWGVCGGWTLVRCVVTRGSFPRCTAGGCAARYTNSADMVLNGSGLAVCDAVCGCCLGLGCRVQS